MLNRFIAMGRLVADPKIATTKDGKEYATFSIAVDTGKEETSFFECIAPAHCCNGLRLTHKGDKIIIESSLRQQHFVRKDGTKGTSIQVVVNSVEFVDVKKENSKEEVDEKLPF